MAELNMTWEDKLKRAEEMQQQRYIVTNKHSLSFTCARTHVHAYMRMLHTDMYMCTTYTHCIQSLYYKHVLLLTTGKYN